MAGMIVFKCKPCFNFQTIEFEVAAEPKDISKVADLFQSVLSELQRIAPEQEKKVIVREPLATEKQKQLMKTHDIPFTATTTSKEAQELIQKSIDAAKNKK